MLTLGVDVGTTGAKAMIFDLGGRVLGYGHAEYKVEHPKPGLAEQNPERIWSIVKKVIKEASQEKGGQVSAISISVQGDAVIAIDENRNAISPAYLGMDYRAKHEARFCAEHFGEYELFLKTGMRPHPMNSIIKILWVKNNEPDIYSNAFKFVTYSDFILGKLGSDDIVIDLSMASRTMAFSIDGSGWNDDILNRLDIPCTLLGKPVTSGIEVGSLSSRLAEELGLKVGTPLIAGGHDQACAALGAGVVDEGLALDSHGTAEVISAALSKAKTDNIMFISHYPCYRHVFPERYFTFALNHTGGILLQWLADQIIKKDSSKTNDDLYRELTETMCDEPSGIFTIPYFNGRGTPLVDMDIKGGFLGLTLSTSRVDLAKSILEALAFEQKINLMTLQSSGTRVEKLCCVGGGARSEKGLQLKADILGMPVSTLAIREAACLGASMLAATAVGAFSDLKEATQIVRIDKTYEPNVQVMEAYQHSFSVYERLYETVKSLGI